MSDDDKDEVGARKRPWLGSIEMQGGFGAPVHLL
jgi:hypothetical protein